MASSRIEVFEQMLESDPSNASVLFGLAKEYEKAGRTEDVVATLEKYLASADDEGNAYGMLAQALERLGQRDAARRAYERGIEVARAHNHPSMAEDYRMTLDSDYEE
ncbi:MAG TPA: tetratricopeptide repeat protein [Pyrinomonadaceae bacterium]|jgi:Flp pilus assembly protein TadD|nr:tetratricopeptide repeat protein [Pyrinomonadaceae bacterium]